MELFNDLKKICSDKILYKKEDIYVYAYDTSQNTKETILPKCVVFPKNAKEVSDIVKYANKNNLKIVPRAQGTNHCGATRPTENSIVLHFSHMNKIIQIDKENLIAIVEPNIIIADLNKELDKQNLYFPPDPSNLAVSTIAGAIALCAGGAATFKYGNTKDYVINLEIVLPNGEIIETSKNISKNVMGYNLTSLFVGSEGTLGIITKATLKLIPKPQTKLLTLAYFDKLETALTCANNIIYSGFIPSAMDMLDGNTIKTIEKFNPCGLLCDKQAVLLIELDGFEICVKEEMKLLKKVIEDSGSCKIVQASNKQENEDIWRARRSAFSAVTQLRPNVITDDIALNRSKMVECAKKIHQLADKYNILTNIIGHVADGNLHPHFALDLENITEKENYNKLKDELYSYVIANGGTLSAEHGIGSAKKSYMQKALDKNTVKLMKEIKNLIDENNIMNPEKSV